MPRVYLIRYGLAWSVARFAFEEDPPEGPLDRGATAVVRTHRGTELGEVLGEAPAAFDDDDPWGQVAPILRVATAADLDRARAGEARRGDDFEACRAVFDDGIWPLDLIDAEPLLDDRRTVLHYLGPHRLDAAGLVAIFRDRCGLDVVLEPAGLDVDDEEPPAEAEGPDDRGCGSCGSKSGGCGSCSSAGGCAIKALVGARGRAARP